MEPLHIFGIFNVCKLASTLINKNKLIDLQFLTVSSEQLKLMLICFDFSCLISQYASIDIVLKCKQKQTLFYYRKCI